MATIASNVLTLMDWAKRQDPDGKTATIVEMLSQENDILLDMLFKEGNLPTGHRTTIRSGLPTVYWRRLNQGVQSSKSTTAQIEDACGKLEAWSEVDVALANLSGNVGQFRLTEAQAFVSAMGQEMASTIFYGNSATAPEEIDGLAMRYSSLSANNGKNIVSGGGASLNSSVWLVLWGDQTVHGIFPKGSVAGLQHKDLGEETVQDAGGVTGAKMRAYRDQFIWDTGVTLKDWRYAVRIANVNISALTTETSAADLVKLMIKAFHRIPSFAMGSAVFYMNRTCHQMLDIQKRDGVIAGGGITYAEIDGKVVMSFRGIPIRRCDALLETEDAVA